MFVKFKQLAGQSSLYTIGELLRSSLSFLLLPLYTRILTPADYGILGVMTPVYSLLSILMALGLPAAMLRFYFDFQDDDESKARYVRSLSSFMALSGVVLGLIMTALGPWVFRLLIPNVPFNPYVLLVIWNAALSTLSLAPMTLFRARQQAHYFIIFTLVDFLLNSTLIIFFVAGQRQGALGTLRGQLLSAAVMAIPGVWILARASILGHLSGGMQGWRSFFSWPALRPSLLFGLPLLPNLVGTWVLNVSDRIVLDSLMPKDAVGLYTLGYQFGILLNLLSVALNNAWTPFFYQNAGNRKNDAMIGAFITYQVLLMAMLSLGVALMAREAIEIIAARVFWPAYQVTPWIALGYLARFLVFFPVNGLLFSKRPKWVAVATLLAAAINISLNLLLIPRFGIMAAAFDTFVAFAALLILILPVGQRLFPLRYETKRLVWLTVAALALFAVGWLFSPAALWLRVVYKAALVLALPLVLWVTGFFTQSERERAMQVVNRQVNKYTRR